MIRIPGITDVQNLLSIFLFHIKIGANYKILYYILYKTTKKRSIIYAYKIY